MSGATTPAQTTEDDITSEVLQRIQGTPDPRTREIMLSLVKHLHAFVKDVRLTEAEWFEGITFLTDTGQKCNSVRQEFILLSDTLGVSMVVDLIGHRRPAGVTESTVFGPFHRDGAPELANGESMATTDFNGTRAVISGRVLNPSGTPIANALLDVWQANSDGLYDAQLPNHDTLRMRGKYRTDKDGRFVVVTSRPVAYEIPKDGPVGRMLAATNRQAWRPAHVHFVVAADGYEPVTTHLFDAADPRLKAGGDAVFGVKESLVVPFREHVAADTAAAKGAKVNRPFVSVEYDFVLKPVG